jgi:DNA-binding response OmpR family regulator
MDVRMPVMDGLDAAREIRRTEAGKSGHVPIIAVTADAMTEDRERCLAAGMDGYLIKPVNIADLHRMLGSVAAEAPQGGRVCVDRGNGIAGFIHLNSLPGFGADSSRVRKYVVLLMNDMTAEISELEKGLAAGDAQTVRNAAHTLKGLAGHLTDGRISRMAHAIQLLAEQSRLEHVQPLLERLREKFEQIARSLRMTPEAD